jgi:uncharacterized integral membrane protein
MAGEVERRGTGKQIDARLVGGGVILLALVAFVGQNREEVPFTFLFLQFTAPLWLMLAGTVVLALLVGFLAGRRSRRPKR